MIRLRSGVVCCQFFVVSKHNILCSSHEIHMKYLYITQTMLPDIFRRCGRMLSVPIRLSATTTNYNTLTLGCIIECLQQAKEFHKKPKTYIFKAVHFFAYFATSKEPIWNDKNANSTISPYSAPAAAKVTRQTKG